MKATIVLATYNEKDNIVKLIEEIFNACKKEKIYSEVVVVDDDSPDWTADSVRKVFRKNKNVKLIVRKNEKGLGSAAGRGAENAKGDVVVFMDADFSHDPRDIPKLVKLAEKYEIVNGSRHMKGGGIETSWNRKLATLMMKQFMTLLLGLGISDYTNGFFAVNKKVLDKLNFKRIFYGYGDYYFRLFYHAMRNGARIKEIPVFYKFRKRGESKTNFARHGMQYAKEALKLRFNF